jgi:large subunit ribosomal protein L25
MQQETLQAVKRVTSGTRASKRLRRDGRIPGVVYGTDIESYPVHVAQRELYAVLHTEAGLNAIIEVDVEGNPVLTVPREVQRDPLGGEITHLDFIKVEMDTEIEAEVGFDFVGIPFGVRESEGIVETLESSITISALPTAIPSSIEVDIEHLALHDTLKVSDLPAIDGVTYVAEDEHPLLTVVLPAIEEEPVVELLDEDGEPLVLDEDGEPVEESESEEDED